MDGAMNVLPDTTAEERYAQIKALLDAEWALIKRTRNRPLKLAHARLHYALRDVAAELGVSPPETDSGGGDKPPQQ